MNISLISYVIGGLINVSWVWLAAIIVGMAGHHLKLSAMDTSLIGGIIMVILAEVFFSLAPNWQLVRMLLLFFSTSYNFALGISIFLVGAGISYITYYALSSTNMPGGKEKD
jgi:hypothetical protein